MLQADTTSQVKPSILGQFQAEVGQLEVGGFKAYDLGIPVYGQWSDMEPSFSRSLLNPVICHWEITPDDPAYSGIWGALEKGWADNVGWGHAFENHPEASYILANMSEHMASGGRVILCRLHSDKYGDDGIFVTTPGGTNIITERLSRNQIACVGAAHNISAASTGFSRPICEGNLRFLAGKHGENLLEALMISTELKMDVWEVFASVLSGRSRSEILSSFSKIVDRACAGGEGIDWLEIKDELIRWGDRFGFGEGVFGERPFRILGAKPLIGFVSAANMLQGRQNIDEVNAMLESCSASSPSNVLTLRPMTAFSHVLY